MTNDDITVCIARVEEQLKSLIVRLDRLAKDNEKCIGDHEKRIRDLEDKQNTLLGKLTAIWIALTAIIGAIFSWVLTWQ